MGEGKITNLDALATKLFKDCLSTVREILKVIISEMNLRIRENKAERKENGLVLKEKDRPRQLYRSTGQPCFFRTIQPEWLVEKVNATAER